MLDRWGQIHWPPEPSTCQQAVWQIAAQGRWWLSWPPVCSSLWDNHSLVVFKVSLFWNLFKGSQILERCSRHTRGSRNHGSGFIAKFLNPSVQPWVPGAWVPKRAWKQLQRLWSKPTFPLLQGSLWRPSSSSLLACRSLISVWDHWSPLAHCCLTQLPFPQPPRHCYSTRDQHSEAFLLLNVTLCPCLYSCMRAKMSYLLLD